MEISFFIDGIMKTPLWSRWKSLNIHKYDRTINPYKHNNDTTSWRSIELLQDLKQNTLLVGRIT
ncbi:hypothetical protein CR513_60216, partial [Mucuna pruriens]